MGQYHKPVSIETEEGLRPYALGCGAKSGEQMYTTPGVAQAMVALVTLRSGNGPADCAGSPVVGRWAGTRVLVQGDYAEDGDILGWQGPRLSELYGAVDFTNKRPSLAEMIENRKNTNCNGARPGTKEHRAYVKSEYQRAVDLWENFNREHPNHAVFADVADICAGLIEGVCSIRYFGQGWRDWVKVRPCAVKITVGAFAPPIGAYMPIEYDAKTWADLERRGITEADWSRVPASGDFHGLLDREVDHGQERVVVNLDTLEYLDPVTFGEVPTLGGMMRGDFGGVATALYATLVHPEARGGGDIPCGLDDLRKLCKGKGPKNEKAAREADGFVGRWRGGRILGTAAYGDGTHPTTEEVRARGKDVSRHAMAYLTAVKNW